MMQTPYDWQEAMGHRAEYIESRLAQGTPVLAVSIADGILFFTFRRQARKLFEIYDELAMAGIGQQSDVEAIRMAALDFAHQEGYARSEQDVTIQRVVSALSSPMKRAFADFAAAPFVARALFAQISPAPGEDRFMMVDYDGDFHARSGFGYLASTPEMALALEERLKNAHLATSAQEVALAELESIWHDAVRDEARLDVDPASPEIRREIALLARESSHVARFRYLSPAD